jgi:hypothetical protein
MSKSIARALAGSALAIAALGACASLASDAKPASSHAAPAASAAPGAPAEDPTSVKGTVLETMDAGAYTYLRLKTAEGEVWAAVPKASVKAGAEVTITGISRMDGFESKTLGRKFDRIWFGALAGDAGAMAARHAAASSAPVEGAVKVEKAAGKDARTVSEIFAGRGALKGKPVAVRGTVVKFSAAIMGRNWIHLRDGSGSPTAKDNDLTVTTDAVAKVGDVVTASGPVTVDKDFGAGYAYPVILEGAKISK